MKTKGKGEILVSVSVSVSVLVFLLGGILCVSGVVLAGDPLEKDGDYDFLWGDPDGDMIYTIEEFEYGTDPYN